LNYTSFFLGLQLGLDHNWDSLDILFSDTFMSIYSNKNYIYIFFFCLSISPVGFIGIICLASTLNLIDRQITNASSSLSKEETNSDTKPHLNLVCSQASAHGVLNYWSFVYNEKDPSGQHLNKLFDRSSSLRETRYIDGVGYSGFYLDLP
jgi:hypothetical protein